MTYTKEKLISNETNLKTQNTRNSLLELYRFLFALWVVWYHSYFIFKNQSFSHGYIAVEFFFLLSGFFLIKSIDKYRDVPMCKGLLTFLFSRIKSLGLPFIVGVIFAIWFMFLEGQVSILGYLWYIPMMLLAFAVIFILRKLIKNDKWFILTLILIVIMSYLILYIPILEHWGIFRGLGGVSLGVLISFIPKFNFKYKFINFNCIITLLLFVLILYLAYIPKDNLISEYFMIWLLLPALIYFTSTLQINCSLLNFLGSLSFGLYAYQCVVRVIEFYFPLAQYWLFLILLGLVLLDKLIIYIYRKYKN